MNEQISALLDGEVNDLERERVLRALDQNAGLRGTWERYHVAGTALRRELGMLVSPGLADRIHARLRDEMPARSNSFAQMLASRRLLKIGAGVAIAASVATVAILSLPPVVPSLSPLARLASTPRGAGAPATVADARPTAAEQQRALSPYLVRHGEFAPAAGMNGMLTYVRVVSHDSANGE